MESPPPSDADVCVVGAGPAGLAAALALSGAGRRVLLLESGGDRPPRAAQELNAGQSVGEPYAGLAETRHRGLGGTVRIWNVEVGTAPGAKYVPLSPDDLAAWPIDFEEIRPWYVEAQALCGLGPFAYDADPWATAARRPFDLRGTGLDSGVYQFGPARRFTHELVAEMRRREGVTLAPHHTVVGLEHAPAGSRGSAGTRRVVLRAVGPDGTVTHLAPRSVVLACGAVENARLLLLAGGAEGRGWLGRGFMEHARDFSLTLEPHDPGVFSEAAFYDLHTGGDGSVVGGRLLPTPEARAEHGLPNASITLVPLARPFRGQRLLPRMGLRLLHAAGLHWSGRYGWSGVRDPGRIFEKFGLVLNLEHRPDPENRIELGRDSDRFGNPLPRLHLRWNEAEQEGLERFRRLLGEWFLESGLGSLHVTTGHRPDLSAHHHAGTTRMASTPRDGVVDPDGRVFGSDNLFVAGASVFPTAGFANPTLTIVAMALRLAAHVDEVLG